MDTQFGLGFARSVGSAIDGPWEKYPGNPVLLPVSFNFGVGHADILVVDGETIMYTATSQTTRGRYVLRWLE
jgi:beta-xylosidase